MEKRLQDTLIADGVSRWRSYYWLQGRVGESVGWIHPRPRRPGQDETSKNLAASSDDAAGFIR